MHPVAGMPVPYTTVLSVSHATAWFVTEKKSATVASNFLQALEAEVAIFISSVLYN
jgi:hypothetical protein